MASTLGQILVFVFSVIVPGGALVASVTVRRWINSHGLIVACVAIVAIAFLVVYSDHLVRTRAQSVRQLKEKSAALTLVTSQLEEARQVPTPRDEALFGRFTRELAPDSDAIYYLKRFSGQRWNRRSLMPLADFRISWSEDEVYFDDSAVDMKRTQFVATLEEFFQLLNGSEGEEIREGSEEYRLKDLKYFSGHPTYEQVTRALEGAADRVLDAYRELMRTGRERRL